MATLAMKRRAFLSMSVGLLAMPFVPEPRPMAFCPARMASRMFGVPAAMLAKS
jgi:hypothetical protein